MSAALQEDLTVPLRPCWLSRNPAMREIFTLRRVYADGVKAHRGHHGTVEWERWAGWRSVQVELADTIAFNSARRHVESHADDLALYRRLVDRMFTVAPRVRAGSSMAS